MSDPAVDAYDAVLLDLDGTVYWGTEPVPGASTAVVRVRDRGRAVRFVTNNASRSPGEVAEHLRIVGIPADPTEVCTSAQAAAALLATRVAPGSAVLVVGAGALADEIRACGLRAVDTASDDVVAVVQGLSRMVGWPELSEACLAIRAGALWVACNIDPTLPTERGPLIGNGALVAAVSTATGREPLIAGKPFPALFHQAASGARARRPLVVGDRLDTDIAGAAAAGMDAMLVLTGVTTPRELLAAPLSMRPRYLAADLTALAQPAIDLAVGERAEWAITCRDTVCAVLWAGGQSHADPLGLLRTLCAVYHPDHHGAVALVPDDETARAALAELGLLDPVA